MEQLLLRPQIDFVKEDLHYSSIISHTGRELQVLPGRLARDQRFPAVLDNVELVKIDLVTQFRGVD